MTRALFESRPTSPPPVPVEVRVRQTRGRDISTIASLTEARRERCFPPCVCHFPSGFAESAAFASSEIQTLSDVTFQMVQTSASEEG